MKKLLLAVLFLMAAVCAHAQFEQGKMCIGTTLTGLNLSYDDTEKFHAGVDAHVGYFYFDDVMFSAGIGFEYGYQTWQEMSANVKGKYYIEQNGVTLSAGIKFTHLFKSYNDLALTPEVGYCFFLTPHIAIEPALFSEVSLNDYAHHSKVGFKIGFGMYFK